MNNKKIFSCCLFFVCIFSACAQESGAERSKKKEVWSPAPKTGNSGKQPGAPPSDAIG